MLLVLIVGSVCFYKYLIFFVQSSQVSISIDIGTQFNSFQFRNRIQNIFLEKFGLKLPLHVSLRMQTRGVNFLTIGRLFKKKFS